MAQPVRVSPGVYRDSSGKLVKGNPGSSAKPSAKPKPAPRPVPKAQNSASIAKGINFNNPNSVAGGSQNLNNAVAQENTMRSNANEVGPYGSKNVTYDAQGRPTVTTELTGANKDLYEGQTKAGSMGAQVSQGLLQNFNYDPNSVNSQYAIPQVNDQYMQRYQNAAYNSLTRNLEKSYARDKEQKAQDLVNRGIPQGSKQFQDEMNMDVENRYNDQRLAAENQSYSAGLGAGQANFGMGLQANQAANQNYNTSFGNRVAWGGQLNNMAQARDVNGQPFQAAQANAADVGGIYGTNSAAKIAAEQARIARMRAAGGGGGGGSSDPAVDL